MWNIFSNLRKWWQIVLNRSDRNMSHGKLRRRFALHPYGGSEFIRDAMFRPTHN
jgi:transposase